MNKELKRLLWEGARTVLVLSLLILLSLAFPASIFLKGGEAVSISEAIRMQATDDSLLFAPAYSNPASSYKLLATDYFLPKILLIGTSRAMEFRARFFNHSFYNAAGAINRVNQSLFFLKNLSAEALPKYYIIILDQNFFNEHFVEADPYEQIFLAQPPPPFTTFRNNIAKIYLDFLQGKFLLADLDEPGIGLRAKAAKNGFRSDGSNDPHHGYALYNKSQQDYQFRYTLETIRNGASIFRYGSVVSLRSLQSLDNLLTYASQHNITVIGVFPPYPPSIWNLIRHDPNFSYLEGLNETVNTIFQKHNMFFFDFSNASRFGGADDEMQDGLHASEEVNAKFLLSVASQEPFNVILNITNLERTTSGSAEEVSIDEGLLREQPDND